MRNDSENMTKREKDMKRKHDIGLPKTSLAENFSLSREGLSNVVLAVQVQRAVVLRVDYLLPVHLWRGSRVRRRRGQGLGLTPR